MMTIVLQTPVGWAIVAHKRGTAFFDDLPGMRKFYELAATARKQIAKKSLDFRKIGVDTTEGTE